MIKRRFTTEHFKDLLRNCNTFGPKRTATGPYDFGDEGTISVNLKRASVEHTDSDFGVFLGQCDHTKPESFVVAIKNMDIDFRITGVEVFDSLEELKQEWQLD